MITRRLIWLGMLLGCQGSPASKSEPPAPAPAPAPAANAPNAPAPSAAPAAGARAGGLRWQDVPPFLPRAPKSSMRVAEYGLSGDERAELVVFYFGPDQGGSVDANVARWLAQFSQPDGSDSASKAVRTEREVDGVAVSVLEVRGTYSGGMAMPGGPPPTPQADAMLLGAIAKGANGPVFFKLVGPRETVERARSGFDQMIGSIRK